MATLTSSRRLPVLFLVLALGLAACGTDDGADVRTIGSESGSGSSGSGSGTGSGSASSAAACVPVGEGGGVPVAVTLTEWAVAPDPAEAPAGAVTFAIDNAGEEVHELVVVRADSPEDLIVTDGQVDEEALPEGAFIGEVEGFPAGETCEGTFELAAGDYVLFCNILETEADGSVESHYEEGMFTGFSVS